VPPANPTPATAAVTTGINNDDLGFHGQIIDLEVISLGDSQWHGIRGFRRDGPPNRPDAGDSNGSTWQDICEHRTATHSSHEFSPLSECFFERGRSHNIRQMKSLGCLQRRIIQHLCIEAHQTSATLN
jgi:hypothetical protein